MLRETILEIFNQTWPSIIITMVIAVSLRIAYLIKSKTKIVLYREIFMLIFIVYVLCLFYVVTFQDVSWSSSNYIPFHEMFRYTIGSRLFFKNVVGNMLLFVPFGFFATYFTKIDKTFPILLLATLTSFTIEITQLIIGRVFDVDDVILNIVGALIGYLLYKLLNRIKDKLPNMLKQPIVCNILVVVLLVFFILYLANYITLGRI